MTPLATRGRLSVFVSAIGYSRNPASAIHARPVISPVPFRTKPPAGTFLCQTSSRGMITVTPVRTGPCPGISGPSPAMSVRCPTLRPGMSVIALSGPGWYRPTMMPSSRARARGSAASESASVPHELTGWHVARTSAMVTNNRRTGPGTCVMLLNQSTPDTHTSDDLRQCAALVHPTEARLYLLRMTRPET